MKVLIYFNCFTDVIGGSEFLPLTLVHEFQKRGWRVTLAVHYPSDINKAQRQYGVSLDMSTLDVVSLEPKTKLELLINRLFRCAFEWKLQRLARIFDLCISTVNPIDFGRPAKHFVYMLGFTEAQRHALGWAELPCGIDTFSHRLWRRFSRWFSGKFIVHIRTADEILRDPRECVYPNSDWARRQIETCSQCTTCDTFYPPTLMQPVQASGTLRKNIVVSIGRIDKIKRIEFQIQIVEAVRQKAGIDLQFVIAGHVKDDDYGKMIKELARTRHWITLAGGVYGVAKERLLTSAKFAIHSTTCEAFGISIVEYLKYGVVPLVPDVGGAAEVVNDENLRYSNFEDAVAKFAKLVGDGTAYQEAVESCRKRAEEFSAESYWQRQKALMDSWGVAPQGGGIR